MMEGELKKTKYRMCMKVIKEDVELKTPFARTKLHYHGRNEIETPLCCELFKTIGEEH